MRIVPCRWTLIALVASLVPASGAAQLRPIEPADWDAVEAPGLVTSLGAAWLGGQRASLAGTEGRLLELGLLRASWGFGRVAVTLSGTAVRLFQDQEVYRDPAEATRPPDGSRRADAGTFSVTTLVALTDPGRASSLGVRFGTRLPTTDDRVGLDRDRTDFFSTVTGRSRVGPWALSGEVGLGVNGTRDAENEQIDPVLYAVRVDRPAAGVGPFLELVGQHDPRRRREIRGTENLGEGRLGIRVGRRRWLRAWGVRGWTPAGPEYGVGLRVGARF